jgi:small subunit ribosomal protein S13
MVFLLGVNFPERQLVKASLESFFGIGEHTSTRLLARFHVHPTAKIGELANRQVLDITAALSNMKIENDLRRQVLDNIRRLKETGTYRGKRHALGLPVRGQNTRNQIKTATKLNRIERRLDRNANLKRML